MANKTVFLTVNFTIDGQYRNAWTYHLPANQLILAVLFGYIKYDGFFIYKILTFSFVNPDKNW